jgi:hypothetical protein
MARFLKTSDYLSIIQTVDLNQITENTPQNLYDSEVKAISRMRTKLVQRYMVDIELGTMDAYSNTRHYRTRDRVIAGEVITHVKDFNRWDKTTEYIIGDIVTDNDGYVYTAIAASQNEALTKTAFWSPMINIVTSNATYWTVGDNRYPMFVELAMDMTLYNLHARINPRNIPDLRIERNREALDQLDRWASGTDTAEVLNINTADSEGFSIRYGNSLDKQDNFFK